MRLKIGNGVTVIVDVEADNWPTTSAWNMVALTIDEAAGVGGSFHYLNGAYNQVSSSNTFDGSYASPSASSAVNTKVIGGTGGGGFPLNSGARVASFAVIEGGILSKEQLDAIWNESRVRFGV